MMRRVVTCLLAAATAMAQAPAKNAQKQPSTPPAAQQGQPAAALAPDQPVLTVRGLCLAQTTAANKPAVPATSECQIAVTKAEFDKLINSFNTSSQPVTQTQLRQMGQFYVELLTFSEAAKAAGVESNPAFIEVMRVLRLRAMADFYRSQMDQQYRHPSEQEIEDYYRNNEAKFEAAKLSRIYLPKNNPDPQATAEQKESYQKKAQQVADDTQARAAKGEEMEKLEKEGYTALGIPAPPPTTDLNLARRGMFPPKLEQEIFSRKAGEVFRQDDANGYMIYRVEDRKPVPLGSVKEQIVREISSQKMQNKIKELTSPVHADFNESYFGPPPPPAAPRPVPTPTR